MLSVILASWVRSVLRAFRSTISRPAIAMAVGLLLLSLCPGIANATTRYWVAYNNGYWVYGPNWTSGVAPSGSENAYINNGYTAWIQGTDAATCGNLYLGHDSGNSGYVNMWGGTLTVNSTCSIGYGGVGGFTLSGGNVSVDSAMYVGRTSSGTLSVSGGGIDITSSLYIGYSGTGTVTLNSGTLSADDYVNIGESGTGYVTQYGGSLVASAYAETDDLRLGVNSGAQGYYTMYGGSAYGSDVYVGMQGTASFVQSGGTLYVANGTSQDHHLYIGSGSGGVGTYRLSGTGVIYLNNQVHGSRIYISSNSGTGRFEWFRSGGIVGGGTNTVLNLNATGTLALGYPVSVDTLANSTPTLGGLTITGHTTGRLEVSNGATITNSSANVTIGKLSVGSDAGGSGTYTLSGSGQLTIGSYNGPIGIGTSTTAGRFEWFGDYGSNYGLNNMPTMTYGTQGTLAMGWSFDVGTLMANGYGALSVNLNNATMEVTNGCTAYLGSGATPIINYLRFGSATGAGYGSQSGGSLTVNLAEWIGTDGSGGSGTYTQYGGTHTVANPNALYLGSASGATGLYRTCGGTLTVNGTIYGPDNGTLAIDGGTVSAGTINVKTFTLGESGYSGSFALGSGQSLTAVNENIGSGGTGTFSQSGGGNNATNLTIGSGSGYTMSGGTLTGGAVIVGQGGAATLSIGAQSPSITTLTMRNGTISGTSGTITATADYQGENGTISAKLAGSVGLLKSTSGGVTLSGSSSYTGLTTIRNGSLTAGASAPSGSAGAFGNATSAIVVGDSGTATADNLSLLISGIYTVGRNVTVNNYNTSGTVTLGGSNTSDTATFSGGITLNRGVNLNASASNGIVLFSGLIGGSGQTATLGGSGSVKVALASAGTTAVNYTIGAGGGRMLGGGNTSGTASFTGNITLNKDVTLTAADGGKADFNTGTWSTGNNGVTITGAGASVVQISNTLSTAGAVSVNSGALWVNGAVAGGGGTLTVGSGATLGGTGTISKPVVVQGTVNAGNSPGVLTVNNNLTLQGDSVFELQNYNAGGPGASYYDGIVVSGTGNTLTFGGALDVVNFGGGPSYAIGQQYHLFDWTGNSETGTFSTINLPSLGSGMAWKTFGAQPFDYTSGIIEVTSGSTTTHYTLAANMPGVGTNVLLNGYVGLTSTIANVGTAPMDTLDFAGLSALSGVGGTVMGGATSDTDVPLGEQRTNTGLVFKGVAYNNTVKVSPIVGSATNHNIGGDAILDSTARITVDVGLATAGPGLDRMMFGPPLVGQGQVKTVPNPPRIVRDYTGLASKTLPSTWEEESEVVGTEAIIREGLDETFSHTVSMDWRQRYDGMVGGVEGSEIPETTLLYSDVVRFTGMDLISSSQWPQDRHQSDVYVLQLSYTGIVDPSIRPGPVYLDLSTDHEIGGVGPAADNWLEAVDGNFAGSPQFPVNLSWEDFRAVHPGDLVTLLGNTGWVDGGNGNGVAWAVIDYDNAQFAVPEPAALSLLTLGGLAMLRRRK